MTRNTLITRLSVAEKKVTKHTQAKAEAEARQVTEARWQEINEGIDTARSKGGDKGEGRYLQSLAPGERLKITRERQTWVKVHALTIVTDDLTHDLYTKKVPFSQWTEAELQSLLWSQRIDWPNVPLEVVRQIEENPATANLEEIEKKYPAPKPHKTERSER